MNDNDVNDTIDILAGKRRCEGCKGRGYLTRNREVAERIYTLRFECTMCQGTRWEPNERTPF